MLAKQNEVGRVGQRRWGGIFYEEFLNELRGVKGVHVYQEMNDETVGAILFAIEMLMRQTTINVEPAGNTEADKRAAEFVQECMDDMEDTWTDTISEILSFLTYGWSYHEIVYKFRNGKTRHKETTSKYADGLIGWRKLPIRSQDTLYGWQYDNGTDNLMGMIQAPPPDYGQITIPLEKAFHFRTKSRKNNPEGRSVLRNAYRSWYFKKRIQEIEGIGIERDLAGFPVLYAPKDMDIWDAEDEDAQAALNWAEAVVTGIRRDAREGLVLPGGATIGEGWRLELVGTGSKRTFDTNAIIERYDKRIATTVLADFVLLGQQAVGSFALASSKTKIFALAIGTYLDIICEVFNNQAIPRLIDLNAEAFKGITDYPFMTHGDIESKDLGILGDFLYKMFAAGALVPDEQLEDFIRQESGMPERVGDDVYHEVQVSSKPDDDKPGNPPVVSRRREENPLRESQDKEDAALAKNMLGRGD